MRHKIPPTMSSYLSKILRNIKACAPMNEDFSSDKSIGYLCFNNGVLDMKTFELKEHSHTYYFVNKINRDFKITKIDPKNDDLVMKTFFETMFVIKDKRNYFLTRLARAIAGEYKDKQFCVLIGDTNCGKTVLTGFFRTTFKSYVGFFNGDELLQKSNTRRNDSARELSFISKIFDKRLSFSNECSTPEHDDRKPTRLHSENAKISISGGDEVDCRKAFEKEIRVINKSSIFMLVNDLPQFDKPDNAIIKRSNYFEADRTSKVNIEIANDTHFPALDPQVLDEYIDDVSVQNSLIKILCEYYVKSVDEPHLHKIKPPCVVASTIEYSGGDERNIQTWVEQNYTIVDKSIIETWIKEKNDERTLFDWDKVGEKYMKFDDLHCYYQTSTHLAINKANFARQLQSILPYNAERKLGGKACKVRVGIVPLDDDDNNNYNDL